MSSRNVRVMTLILVLSILIMPIAVFAEHEVDVVHGTVFHDLNQDGIFDDGEVGIAGVTIDLYEADVLIATTTSDGDGAFEFSGLANGNYTIVETDPTGFISTTPNEVDFAVDGMATIPTVDFGDVPVNETGSISGTVYEDLNRSRLYDAGDVGLPGVTVLIKNDEGEMLASVITDEDGLFSFDTLLPGTYVVRELDPHGYYSTTPHEVVIDLAVGAKEVVDFGDFVPEPGETSPIDLPITRFFDLPLLDVLELRSIDKLGYGNIAKLYFLAHQSGLEISEILSIRKDNGWGNVMKQVLGRAGLKGYNLGLIMSGREMPNQVQKIIDECPLVETQEDYQELIAVGGNQGQIKKICKEVMQEGGTFEDLKGAFSKPDKGKSEGQPSNAHGPPACKGKNKNDPGCE